MKKTIATLTLAIVMGFGTTFANANSGIMVSDRQGIMISDRTEQVCGEVDASSTGIIIGGFANMLEEMFGIIIGGRKDCRKTEAGGTGIMVSDRQGIMVSDRQGIMISD